MYRAKHGSRHHEEQTQPRLHHRAYMQHGAASQGHDSGRLQAIAGGDSWKRRAIGPTSERFFPFPWRACPAWTGALLEDWARTG